ncbi:MAG: DUF2141 domain-containing protein [Saprospiraceae bacterium]
MLLPLAALLMQNIANATAQTTLVATNVAEAKGQICLAIFNSKETFMDAAKVAHAQAVPVGKVGSLEIQLPDLPPGQYAASVFHDLNSNGKLDTNLFGIPTEPYGFSNNVRPKFRAARWDEAVFQLKEGQNRLEIRLDTW